MPSKYLSVMLSWLHRLSGWLLFLSIIWLCWVLARLLWLFLAPPQAPALPLAIPQQVNQSSGDNHRFVLFDNPNQQIQPNLPPPNIKLKGIMLAKPERFSSAVLEVDGKVKNYHLQDTLADGRYQLVSVNWNEVIISDNAHQETVLTLLQPMSLNQAHLDSQVQSGVISNNPLPQQYDEEALSLGEPINNNPYDDTDDDVAPSVEQSSDNHSMLNDAVDELQQDPTNYLNRMGIVAMGNGYEVSNAMPEEIRNRLGLEIGDKVTSVNGQAVGSDLAKDAELLKKIQQSGEAEVQVQRGEQLITIRQQF